VPTTGSGALVDILLLSAIAIAAAGGVFIFAVDAWRYWSKRKRK
jgi:hypothetical protein